MRCLSVRQPWAWAIASGRKRIENRSWSTTHRGDLVIHAGKSLVEFDSGIDFAALMPGLPPRRALTFGAIVGVVKVVACVPYAEVEGRPFAEPGGYCWILEHPRIIDPILWPGQLGLFEVPDRIIAEALESLAHP
jgi:ASCH domain